MLTSLVFVLHTEKTVTIARNVGAASHAVFLSLIAELAPELAERIHRPDQQRPFTCSSLVGGRPRGAMQELAPDQDLFLRYTGLTEEVSAHLQNLAAAPPPKLQLLNAALNVTAATLDPDVHPWAGQATYEALAARRLRPGNAPERHTTLRFVSPTAFRSGGRVVPLPLPDLVYGSLVNKWNAFANVAISEEVRRYADECMGVSRYRLETRAIRSRGGSMQIGFTGRCRFTAFNSDRYWLAVVQLLTDYAFYAGIGYQTTMGMGQARRDASPPGS